MSIQGFFATHLIWLLCKEHTTAQLQFSPSDPACYRFGFQPRSVTKDRDDILDQLLHPRFVSVQYMRMRMRSCIYSLA